MAVTKKQMATFLADIESGRADELVAQGYDAFRLMDRYNVSRNTLHKYFKGVPRAKESKKETHFMDELSPARRLALTLPWVKTKCTSQTRNYYWGL